MKNSTQYDLRSLQHERHMLDLYRAGSARDSALLPPLANACWRASAFEWRLSEDSDVIRGLWREGARALADGFVRRRMRVQQSPEELLLALHLALASRSFDLVGRLTHITTETSGLERAKRVRSRLLLLEAYLAITREIFENRSESRETIQRLIDEAVAELDREVRREQFVSTREVAWRIDEHEHICALLRIVASLLSEGEPTAEKQSPKIDLTLESSFASLMDRAMKGVEQFVDGEGNHRPKFYFWLPGIALTVLAEAAGLSLEWLREKHGEKSGAYARLPLKLVLNN
ncbi:MAG TPA: hypothetical protein VKB46_28955 [Pyrinomonadaceae bacterium]|nr:hypothetical protein [Pyrinomonadaceae bacterium]